MVKLRWIPWPVALFLSISVALASMAGCSTQAAWPTKAIEVMVPVSAGGGLDTTTRFLAKYLSRDLGQPVNVTNKPGGNQIPGIVSVLTAAADGYTLMAENPSTGSLQATIKDLPYKLEDRTFGPLLLEGRSAFVVNGRSPWKTLKEAMDAAKKDPASFTWTRLGGNSAIDFAILGLMMAAGIDIEKTKPVTYGGGGPGLTAVAGGHTTFGASGAAAVLPLLSSGDLRVLAVNGDKRLGALPDVPSAKEAGYDVGFVVFYGVSGPKGLPKNVLDRLDAAAKKIADDPTFKKEAEAMGTEVRYMSPDQTRARILKEADDFRAMFARLPASLR